MEEELPALIQDYDFNLAGDHDEEPNIPGAGKMADSVDIMK